MDINNFQRVGALSNTHAGNDFEGSARAFFAKQGIKLTKNFSVPVGVGENKKPRRFDLGSENPPVLVECKSHTWTQGGNMPSAKMTVWNEAMYYFHVAPPAYRKIFSFSSMIAASRVWRPIISKPMATSFRRASSCGNTTSKHRTPNACDNDVGGAAAA